MSIATRRELVPEVAPRYRLAGKPEKGRILDELVATTGYDRKYALRLLKAPREALRADAGDAWRPAFLGWGKAAVGVGRGLPNLIRRKHAKKRAPSELGPMTESPALFLSILRLTLQIAT